MADARAEQFALVAIVGETPPAAGGALVSQFAIVTISKEFVIPLIYVPLGVGQFMATMPYFIGE